MNETSIGRYCSFYEIFIERKELHNTYTSGSRKEFSLDFDIDLSKEFIKEHKLNMKYPRGSKYIVIATHDVDNIYPSLGIIKYYVKKNPLKAMSYFIGRIRGSKHLFLNLNKIVELELNKGFKSSFYLLVSDRDVVPFYKSYYGDKKVYEEIGRIRDKVEFGLHTGYYSYDDLGLIIEEKKRVEELVGKRIYGVRNHYLNFKVPSTWRLLVSAGFLYDTTLGFNKGFGYWNKMCHPYIPYDPGRKEWISIWELPLTIMDRGLINADIDPGDFFEKYRAFIEKASKYGCFIVLLWHNDILFDPRFKKYGELYWRLVDYALENEGAVLNSMEALNVWLKTLE